MYYSTDLGMPSVKSITTQDDPSYYELLNRALFETKQLTFKFMWQSWEEKERAMPCFREDMLLIHPDTYKMWMELEYLEDNKQLELTGV